MKSIFRWISQNSDITLATVTALTAVFFLRGLGREPPDQANVYATLAGALFGAVAVLAGNWINRRSERAKLRREQHDRKAKVATIVTAELVDVMAGLVGAAGLLIAAAEQVRSGGGTVPLDLTAHLPSDMPLTFESVDYLCLFEQPAIDALVTLRNNLEISSGEMHRISQKEIGAWRTDIARIARGLAHTMDVLAQCFERVAPTRKIKLQERDPELASAFVRKEAQALLRAAAGS